MRGSDERCVLRVGVEKETEPGQVVRRTTDHTSDGIENKTGSKTKQTEKKDQETDSFALEAQQKSKDKEAKDTGC